ncbi:MAG TPA: DUF2797 domain-containing protein [Polyangiaceae bacterium]|nr:DUF2797 domain-containing protein [Polyangiaceae bacterium]
MSSPGFAIGASDQTLLAGYGCDERGPFLVVDPLGKQAWQRQLVRVRGSVFTFSRCDERHCVGRHDLETGRSVPCPQRVAFGAVAHEQCSDCFTATGFNPAFYNSPRISDQQRRRNLEPHVVYVVSFGVGALKVGMAYAPRRLSRLLEQGARLGAVIACLPNADRARELEASIARELDVSEFVRAGRKRQLLSAPLSPSAAREELALTLSLIAERHPEAAQPDPIQELDDYYFGGERLPSTLTDLSETLPHAISGRCVGMIGDVLVCAQREQRFLLSIGDSVGHRVRLEALERENRFVGQLGLPF